MTDGHTDGQSGCYIGEHKNSYFLNFRLWQRTLSCLCMLFEVIIKKSVLYDIKRVNAFLIIQSNLGNSKLYALEISLVSKY